MSKSPKKASGIHMNDWVRKTVRKLLHQPEQEVGKSWLKQQELSVERNTGDMTEEALSDMQLPHDGATQHEKDTEKVGN